MSETVLERLLAGRFVDPDDGAPIAVATERVAIAPSLAGDEAGLVNSLDLGARLAVVSDPTTRTVLGERVERALASIARIESVVLGDAPHADQETVDRLRIATSNADTLVAVGSGTINDLCKAAAAGAGKPYIVFGTAPSMNGFSSVTAAVTVNGLKKTVPGVAARGVFLDLTVLAGAPDRLIRSGLGDSLCRATCQADWRLAQELTGAPYREAPFSLLAEDEAPLFAESDALLAGDLKVMERLARTLVLSGFGMAICGGSEPASEGEHLIAHYGEMRSEAAWPALYHGEAVGIATVTMARLYESLLARRPRVAPTVVSEDDVTGHFGTDLGALCWTEFSPKRLDAAGADAMNQRLEANWDAIAERLSDVLRPAAELEATLRRAGAPFSPADTGWPSRFYRDAVLHAREIRNRYTALDLAGDAGRLDEVAGG